MPAVRSGLRACRPSRSRSVGLLLGLLVSPLLLLCGASASWAQDLVFYGPGPADADFERQLPRILDKAGLELALDSFAKAREQRPDHVSSHRFLALAHWSLPSRCSGAFSGDAPV